MIKYLIGDKDGKLYTIEDGALKELEDVPLIKAQTFEDFGFEDTPQSEILATLINPEVLCWTDEETLPELSATVSGTPQPQVVYSKNYDMSDATIIGVESVKIEGDNDTLYAVSFDDGETWWNYVSPTWVSLSEETSGQTREDIEAISTSAWAEKATTGMIKFRFVLSTATNTVSEVRINYLNTDSGEPTYKTLIGLTVKTPPTNQIYTVGDRLDLTGILVIAEYDTGAKAAVSLGCRYNPGDGDVLATPGVQPVSVSYTESDVTKTTEFLITVNEAE